jgi:hypothetical protein
VPILSSVTYDSRASARALREAKLGAPLVLDAVCTGMVRWKSSRDRDFLGTVGLRLRGKDGAASASPCRPRRLYDRARTQAARFLSIGARLDVLLAAGQPEFSSPPRDTR